MSVEKKIEALIEESRSASQIIGALTGVGGAFTGGGLNGSYNAYKQGLANKDLRRIQGEPGAATAADNILPQVGYSLAGSIPVVGSITNAMAAGKRWDELEKLNLERAKKGLPPVE